MNAQEVRAFLDVASKRARWVQGRHGLLLALFLTADEMSSFKNDCPSGQWDAGKASALVSYPLADAIFSDVALVRIMTAADLDAALEFRKQK